MIPMPPSHCVNWRHIARLRGSSSTLTTMLPPVVLKPDIPSKYASIGREICGSPEKMYGSAPSAAAASQVSETTRKPSRTLSRWSPRVVSATARPIPPASAPEARNGHTGSPYPSATAVGTSVAKLR